MRNNKRKILGRYIVADQKICHGHPTFIGTRIMVYQVVWQVANGKSWEGIVADWRGRVSKEAIAEAIAFAKSIKAKTGKDVDQHWKGPFT